MNLDFLNPLAKKKPASLPEEKRSRVRELKHNAITWIDVENPTRKELTPLAEKYDFHPLHVEASLAKGQLDQLAVEGKYIFLLLRSPKYKLSENKVVAHKVCVFLGKNYVVTIHRDATSPIGELFKVAEADDKRLEELFKKSAGYLAYQILGSLTEDIAGLLERLLQEVEDIEDLVFDVNVSGAFTISQLRQKIIKQKRIITSFRNILHELSGSSSELIDNLTRYYTSLTMRLRKLGETLEEAQETVEIYKDADFTVSTERTNKILGILTIIFTLGMPATIVGSFYGMNILMPGGIEAGSWLFWGPFTTFYLVLAMAIGPVVLMLMYFKYKQWF